MQNMTSNHKRFDFWNIRIFFAEGCRYNEHCPEDQACIQGRCDSPCRPGACGFKALCRAYNHQAECICPQEHKGDPHIQCNPEQRGECQQNSDCLPNEICEDSFCIGMYFETLVLIFSFKQFVFLNFDKILIINK